MDYKLTLNVKAPAERVWEQFLDVERWPQMTKSISEVRRLQDGPLQVGSQAIIKQPGLPRARWQVTELDPGHSFTWQTSSGGVTTAGSHAKVAKAKELGADLVINYKTDNVPEAIKRFAPNGVNVWWETLREPDFDKAISLLSTHGRMIIMAGRDARPPFPVGPFYAKSCSLFGFVILDAAAEDLQTAANDINEWMSTGKTEGAH